MKKRLELIRKYTMLLSIASMFILLSALVLAQTSVPQGPDTITIAGSGRHQNASNSVLIQAQAGNVTPLVISHVKSTEAWQGYYGNITGTIVLDDTNNQTLFDWSLPNPTGEVYASNGSIVTWSKVYCMNVSPLRSSNGSGVASIVYSINGSQIELNFGINVTDKDGLNETFNTTYTSATGFRTGSITIDSADGCSLANPYTNQASSLAWEEVLLSDNESLIFTGLVRENADGYQTGATDTFDFQMLVLENGHPGADTTLTNYFFFVELA